MSRNGLSSHSCLKLTYEQSNFSRLRSRNGLSSRSRFTVSRHKSGFLLGRVNWYLIVVSLPLLSHLISSSQPLRTQSRVIPVSPSPNINQTSLSLVSGNNHVLSLVSSRLSALLVYPRFASRWHFGFVVEKSLMILACHYAA